MQDEWDQLEDRAMLAQRLALGGDSALALVADEQGLQPADVRKWHKAWCTALLGPLPPGARWLPNQRQPDFTALAAALSPVLAANGATHAAPYVQDWQ